MTPKPQQPQPQNPNNPNNPNPKTPTTPTTPNPNNTNHPNHPNDPNPNNPKNPNPNDPKIPTPTSPTIPTSPISNNPNNPNNPNPKNPNNPKTPTPPIPISALTITLGPRRYESFQRQCPDGRISRAEFEKIYGTFFPNSDPQGYARHVFRSFDTNDDGTLDFREYIIALHLTSSGKTHLKLEWAFSLFDVDRNGEVSKSEVLEIITVRFGVKNGRFGVWDAERGAGDHHGEIWGEKWEIWGLGTQERRGQQERGAGDHHGEIGVRNERFGNRKCRNGEVSKSEVLEIITVRFGVKNGRFGVWEWQIWGLGCKSEVLEIVTGRFGVKNGRFGNRKCRNGEVSKSEVLEIITAIFKMIPAEEQKLLPEDENNPQKRADKLWAYFNKGENDKIAEAEFIEGVMKNDAIMRLIQYEPKK
ncbi:recoverin isoform X3 [Agelaius tricolor]|uniref:recoverin isoform X3 n=1 Tax=Agelaius tricolor TaxID=9191 RepID=UPI0039F24249